MKFIWQQGANFCLSNLEMSCIYHEFVWSYASSKIPTIALQGHVSDDMSALFFTQQPYLMSSKITRTQAKETNAGVALTTRRFILNIQVIQTKFICSVDAISMRDMVSTLSVQFMTVNFP